MKLYLQVLLSLDPEGDPLAVVLIMDFYALRAKEYSWFVQFAQEWESRRNLSQLPNFAYSLALANFHLSSDDNYTIADKLLQDVLIMFPGVLMPLLEKCAIQPDPKVTQHEFFGIRAEK